jgi:hypothetical protein
MTSEDMDDAEDGFDDTDEDDVAWAAPYTRFGLPPLSIPPLALQEYYQFQHSLNDGFATDVTDAGDSDDEEGDFSEDDDMGSFVVDDDMGVDGETDRSTVIGDHSFMPMDHAVDPNSDVSVLAEDEDSAANETNLRDEEEDDDDPVRAPIGVSQRREHTAPGTTRPSGPSRNGSARRRNIGPDLSTQRPPGSATSEGTSVNNAISIDDDDAESDGPTRPSRASRSNRRRSRLHAGPSTRRHRGPRGGGNNTVST